MLVEQTYSAKPWTFLQSAWRHRQLIFQLSKREVVNRYKGSVLGIVWSFIYPLLLLAVYTFVFRVIFTSRWESNGGNMDFAVVLFAGLIIYNFFAESVGAAPALIPNHVSYVKKVIFPLEILSFMVIGNALFHACVSLLVLLIALFAINGAAPWTFLLVPLPFIPLMLLSLGAVWLLSALGVYLRDVQQVVNVLLVLLLFMSPIFYPAAAVPEALRPILAFNPLTPVLEQTRALLIEGKIPGLLNLTGTFALAWLIAWAGFAWFQKTRKGFADVI